MVDDEADSSSVVWRARCNRGADWTGDEYNDECLLGGGGGGGDACWPSLLLWASIHTPANGDDEDDGEDDDDDHDDDDGGAKAMMADVSIQYWPTPHSRTPTSATISETCKDGVVAAVA